MFAARAKRLLTTEGKASSVHKITKKFPSGGHLIAHYTLCLGHPIDRGTSRHRSRIPFHTASLKKRYSLHHSVGNNGETVRGVYEESISPQQHISVAVTIKRRGKFDFVIGLNQV